MKYTNKHNLSPEICQVIVDRQNKYSPGDVDYSVTEILNPPRIVHLTKRHYDELEMDVVDVLSAWEGHLLHDALEKDETSRRLQLDVYGIKLSGAYDYFSGGQLKDYKRTSVWSYVFGSVQKKWEQQLNCYAYMLRQQGEEVHSVGIEVFLSDWNKNEALRNKDYPKCPQFFLRMPLWDDWKCWAFTLDRLRDLEKYKKYEDVSLPECTEEEMWAKPTTWAVKRKGVKRALRVFDSYEASQVLCDGTKNAFVEKRPGERVRCQKYCNVSKFCNQWEEYCRNQENVEL